LFVFAAAIFRSEVALLLGATVFHQLVIPAISLERVIFPFAASFLVSLAISVPLDSYFWQQPIWPELWGFYFNVVHGNASNWGVSPWHYYFTSALPRLLINPLTYVLLIPYALYHPATARAASRLVVPSLLFTAIYSFQPHKEARFIFYVVPPLTAAAALGANRLFLNAAGSSHQSKSKPTSPFSILLAILILLSIAASFAASTAMLAISALNYPGGEALTYLRTTILRDPSTTAAAVTTNNSEHHGIVTVHADVLSCMTGVTLFGSSTATSLSDAAAHAFAASAALKKPTAASSEEDSDSDSKPIRIPSSQQQQQNPVPQLAVDKTESPSLLNSPDFWNRFDYLLTEDPSRIPSLTNPDNNQEGEYEWYTLATIQGYAGIEILRPGQQEPSDNDETNGGSKNIVGHGRTIARLRRLVRNSGLTKGWWVGPRMKDRVYILQKKRKSTPRSEQVEDERGKKRRAVDAR
jgi:alpha-1,6-mannosyltransferase